MQARALIAQLLPVPRPSMATSRTPAGAHLHAPFLPVYLFITPAPSCSFLPVCHPCGPAPQIAMFSYLVGIEPSSGVRWNADTWHFFLYVLNCLRILLAGELCVWLNCLWLCWLEW